jgi:hypothetical protein
MPRMEPTPPKGVPKLHPTPFRVYLDPLSPRSVWLVLDQQSKDELGEDFDIPLPDNSWDYLPSAQNDRNLFKVIILQPGHELGSN